MKIGILVAICVAVIAAGCGTEALSTMPTPTMEPTTEAAVPAPTIAPSPTMPACDGSGMDRGVCCPEVLGNPARAVTIAIEMCATWWGNLPTDPPRPAIDAALIKQELCTRGASYVSVAHDLNIDPVCD